MATKIPKDDEPKVWVTIIKLVVGLTVMIGGVGLALWYAKDMDNGSPTRRDNSARLAVPMARHGAASAKVSALSLSHRRVRRLSPSQANRSGSPRKSDSQPAASSP